ncbi:MAG: hypothetical protein JOZ65_21560 [Chloroflexi bacterium]|nr:hypothetical protein [Chloroflexota bacterium]
MYVTRLTRRRVLAAFAVLGLGALLDLSRAQAQPIASTPTDLSFRPGSSLRLQQLVGDVDVTRIGNASEPYWHPTDKRPEQANSIGYYPGGPPIKRADGEIWSDSHSSVAPTPFPEGPTPQLGYYYNIFGSDKARCFAGPDGNLLFLFGDIRGQTPAPWDTIAYSDTSDPEPGGIDLWCYTSAAASFPKQPRNQSDPHPPAFNGPYTLLAFPSNPQNRPNPLDLKFSIDDMGVDNSPFSGVYVPRADDPGLSATYVTFRFRTLPLAGSAAPVGQTPPPDCSELKNCTPGRIQLPPGGLAVEQYARMQAEAGTATANILTRLNPAYATSPRTLQPATVDPKAAFEYLRVISQTPYKQLADGTAVPLQSPLDVSPCFINTELHTYDASYPSYVLSGLGPQPPSGGYLLMFGTGTIRGPLTVLQPTQIDGRTTFLPTAYDLSTVFLSAQDYADVESNTTGLRIFTGVAADTSVAQWTSSSDPSDAYPVLGGTPQAFAYHGIGDFSVACLRNQLPQAPELWLMMCDGSQANGWMYAGIHLFWSLTPWGPWKPASQTGKVGVFNTPDGQGDPASGGFIQQPIMGDFPAGNGLNGPVIGPEKNARDTAGQDSNSAAFKVYGPVLIEKFCKLASDPSSPSSAVLTVYWTMCTWIPYYAVLMRSQFDLTF